MYSSHAYMQRSGHDEKNHAKRSVLSFVDTLLFVQLLKFVFQHSQTSEVGVHAILMHLKESKVL